MRNLTIKEASKAGKKETKNARPWIGKKVEIVAADHDHVVVKDKSGNLLEISCEILTTKDEDWAIMTYGTKEKPLGFFGRYSRDT